MPPVRLEGVERGRTDGVRGSGVPTERLSTLCTVDGFRRCDKDHRGRTFERTECLTRDPLRIALRCVSMGWPFIAPGGF